MIASEWPPREIVGQVLYVLRKIWHDAHQAKHYRPCIVPHVDPIVHAHRPQTLHANCWGGDVLALGRGSQRGSVVMPNPPLGCDSGADTWITAWIWLFNINLK